MKKIKKFIAIILILAVMVPISVQNAIAATGENLETLSTDTPQLTKDANNEIPDGNSELVATVNLTSETDENVNTNIEKNKDDDAVSENAYELSGANVPNVDINNNADEKANGTASNEDTQPSETTPDNNKDEQPTIDKEQNEAGDAEQPSLDSPENNKDEQPAGDSGQKETGKEDTEKDAAENDNEIKPELSEEEPLENTEEGIEALAVSDDWEYTVNSNGTTVTITKYKGSATEVTVPETLDGKNVTGLKGVEQNDTIISCFDSNVTSVTIPQGVISISKFAFYRCASLASITIPQGVTSIGYCAFAECTSLANVTIPEGVRSLDIWAFADCTALTSVTIPGSMSYIGQYAFRGCKLLTSVNIPQGVISIGDCAFSLCTSLTSVTIPESVTSIGNWAFADCTSLTSVNIPQGITSIGEYTFKGCTSLTSITIPEGVTSIGDWSFAECTSLTSMSIPQGVTNIGTNVFKGCALLTSLIFPSSLTILGNDIVSNCTKLTSIKFSGNAPATNNNETLGTGLPTNYKTIYTTGATGFTNPWRGYPAREEGSSSESDWEYKINSNGTTVTITRYKGCDTEITVPEILDGKKVIELTGTYNPSTEKYISCFNSNVTSVSIPQGVTNIGEHTFLDCTSLTSVSIPHSVTSIGTEAFLGCTSLANINLPPKLTYFGFNVFYKCKTLKSIIIPDGVTSIDYGTFAYCDSLKSVTMPQSITSIGWCAFADCGSLTNITIPDNVTEIIGMAFSNCTSLTSLIFPASLTTLENYVVDGCSSLNSIKFLGDAPTTNGETLGRGLPNNYETIYATGKINFTNPWRGYPAREEGSLPTSVWEYLENPDGVSITITKYKGTTESTVNIPSKLTVNGVEKTVTQIADNAIAYHNEITSLTIPSTVTAMGNKAFASCNNLTSVTIPAAVVSSNTGGTNSGEWFYDCQKLSTVTFQDGATIISAWSLAHMPALTTVNIPSSVRTIGAYAFYGCPKLSAPTIPNQVTNIGNNAFSGSGVTTITVPSGVTKVEPDTFKDCDNLTQVNLPSTVTHIKQYAFTGCSNLTTITIPEGPQTIEDGAFQNCNKLTFLVIPASVTTMGDRVVEGCSALQYIEFKGNAPAYAGTGTPILAPKQPLGAKLPDKYVSKYHYGKTGFPPTGEIWRNWPVLMLGAPQAAKYTVTFKDWDGRIIDEQEVTSGAAATAPAEPTRQGYTFRKWDNDFSIVTSNLTVTALYIQNEVALPKYEVIFKDWDGTELSRQNVEEEKSAKKPADPIREGYTFIGWDKPFNSITENLTITAQYKINEYTVTFKDWNGAALKTQTVNYQQTATAPSNPTRTGYTFKNWDKPFNSVTENLIITAQYTINTYTVTFKDWDGKILKTQSVKYQESATAPSNPTRSGYIFKGWDKPFNNITADTIITAQYENNAAEFTVTFKDWNGVQLSTQKVKEGTAAQAPANPTRWGYTFTGWDKPFNKITADTLITAQYTLRNATDVSEEELKKLDPNDPNYYDKIKELEEKFKELYGIKVDVDVDPNTHGNFHKNSNKIDIIGAAFNAKPNETLNLHFSKPDTNVIIDGERYKTNNAVQIDIDLLNSGRSMGKLTYPILIKAPVPTGLDPEDFRILHYHANGSIEKIKPKLNGDGTCTFTVNSFSVFVFVEEIILNQPPIPGNAQPQTPDVGLTPTTPIGSGNDAGYSVIIETTVLSPKTGDDYSDGYPNIWDRLFYATTIPLLMFIIIKARKSYIKK